MQTRQETEDFAAAKFAGMSRADMAAWYLENVGYDPTKDDFGLSDEQLRADCEEMYFFYNVEVDSHGRTRADDDFDPTV